MPDLILQFSNVFEYRGSGEKDKMKKTINIFFTKPCIHRVFDFLEWIKFSKSRGLLFVTEGCSESLIANLKKLNYEQATA